MLAGKFEMSVCSFLDLFFFFALRNVLCLVYLFGLFTKVLQVAHPLQNEEAVEQEVLERICTIRGSYTAWEFLVAIL